MNRRWTAVIMTSLTITLTGCSSAVKEETHQQAQTVTHHDEEEIHHESHTCQCGHEMTVVSELYGEWSEPEEQKCEHHVYGTDLVKKRTADLTYRCESCGKEETVCSEETELDCKGYDF